MMIDSDQALERLDRQTEALGVLSNVLNTVIPAEMMLFAVWYWIHHRYGMALYNASLAAMNIRFNAWLWQRAERRRVASEARCKALMAEFDAEHKARMREWGMDVE